MDHIIGDGGEIHRSAIIGFEYDEDCEPAVLGKEAVVRSGSVIYGDVVAGDHLQTGHDVLIREQTVLGDNVLVGTKTVIDGRTEIGSNVSLQTGVYIPTQTTIGSNVFIGPQATLTNDPYPLRQKVDLQGPIVEDNASIGANATLLPGVSVGERSFVAAGAVVTDDVPSDTLAVGNPAEYKPLPEKLKGENVHV